jgi:hypothetical protein
VSRVGLGFRLTQNLGFLEKYKASLFSLFLGFDLTVALRSCPPLSFVRIFCLRRFGT